MRMHMDGSKVTLTSAFATVTVNGKRVTTPRTLTTEDTLAWNGLTATVITRTGNRTFLRVADPHSPNLQAFHGLKFYPVDAHYRIEAKWVPYTTPHTLRMGTVTGDVLELPCPGYAEFTLNGITVRLEPYESVHESLAFLFRDGTGLNATYGAGRELEVNRPSNGLKASGTVILDFNRAFNPPCAYTEYGTCPLAPAQNRFRAEIPAGEKRYHE